MKKRILAAIALIYFVLLQACSTINVPEPELVLLQNVNIVDPLNERIISGQQIIMENGLISAIQPDGTPLDREPVTFINGDNGYVTPGLIDMHTHIYDKAAMSLGLSHGVVHQRVMRGMPQILQWRDDAQQGEIWGSTLSVSSPIVSGIPDIPLNVYAGSSEEGARVVMESFEAGYDLIKAYNTLSAETLHAVLIQAEDLGIPVAQHAPHPPEGMQWQELAGLQTFEHVEDIYQGPLKYQQDQVKLDETIAELKTLGVPISGTLAIYQQLTRLSAEKSSFLDAIRQDYTSPFIRYYEKQDQVKRWLDASDDHANYNLEVMAYLLEITRQLHQQDVELVLGSDSGVLLLPIGLGTHEELALLHQSGLSPYEALKAATVNPAKVLGKSEELGQIKPGYRADFIYSYQNPTEDLSVLRYPDAVLKSGHWYDDKQLEYIRRKAINSRNIFSELWVILSNY